MFTGIVTEIGTVRSMVRRQGGLRLTIEAPRLSQTLRRGNSVNVAGVCQTVERLDRSSFVCTAVSETLRKTRLGSLRPGAGVNLEPAVTAETPLGGHIVSGHTDTLGRMRRAGRRGTAWELTVAFDRCFDRWVVEHGSIAIEGVSLTVAQCDSGQVTAAIIPETLERTTLGALRANDSVNLEFDQMVKAAVQAMSGTDGVSRGVTADFLARAGWWRERRRGAYDET